MYIEKERELIRKIQTVNAENYDKWNADIDRLFEHVEAVCYVSNYYYGALEGHPKFWEKEKRTWKEVSDAGKTAMREINKMCEEYNVPHVFEQKELDAEKRALVEICEQYETESDEESIRMQKEAGYE